MKHILDKQKEMERVRPNLEAVYSSREALAASDRQEISNKDFHWQYALGEIEVDLERCGQRTELALTRNGYVAGRHPLMSYGFERDKDARDARLFWDQVTAFSKNFFPAVASIQRELKEIKETLDRRGRN